MTETNDTASSAEPNDQAQNSQASLISMSEFLQTIAPNQMRVVADLVVTKKSGFQGQLEYHIATPDILLHCDHALCGGQRTFRYSGGATSFYNKHKLDTFIEYTCANCDGNKKRFSLHGEKMPNIEAGKCYKFGELPHFGPPTPTKLLRLLGSDKDLFLKGRRCESLGLGVGAYTYYRRVVENRKNEIIGEILKVATAVSASEEVVSKLKSAKKEISFSKAVEGIKDAIPQTLLINGHNPLTLLHTALSVGVHEHSDEFCLELAHDVRIVLVELADKVSAALKDEAELKAALGRLMNASGKPSKS